MRKSENPTEWYRLYMRGRRKALKEQDFLVKHIIYPDKIETQQTQKRREIKHDIGIENAARIAVAVHIKQIKAGREDPLFQRGL